jgi:hypothetical protein
VILRVLADSATLSSRRAFSARQALEFLFHMIIKFAREFILLGQEIAEVSVLFQLADSAPHDDPDKPLTDIEKKDIASAFEKIAGLCVALELPTSKHLFGKAILYGLPETGREFNIYVSALHAEIKEKVFAFIPDHKKKYFWPKKFLSEPLATAFPSARNELREAGKCFAVDRNTAAVFHCMRAIEIGLRAMATDLQITFDVPLDLVDWEGIIRKIESKIAGMKDRAKSGEKDEDQHFYSNAAMQFRYFKDGFRVRVAHTRATYDESQALGVIEHAVTFFEVLSSRLKEPLA